MQATIEVDMGVLGMQDVVVHYTSVSHRSATDTSPEEGGIEIDSIYWGDLDITNLVYDMDGIVELL